MLELWEDVDYQENSFLTWIRFGCQGFGNLLTDG